MIAFATPTEPDNTTRIQAANQDDDSTWRLRERATQFVEYRIADNAAVL